MRRQFTTLPNSKEERKIITYQAVAGRIVDGYAMFIAFSDLYTRIIEQDNRYLALAHLLQATHHTML